MQVATHNGCADSLVLGIWCTGELHRFAGDYSVRGVGQFKQHFVRVRFQADHDHCFAAGVDKKCHGQSSTAR